VYVFSLDVPFVLVHGYLVVRTLSSIVPFLSLLVIGRFLCFVSFCFVYAGWHRCMSLEEQGVSTDICAEKNLDLKCINPRNQVWDNTHGDW
jgi:hypothetical protein